MAPDFRRRGGGQHRLNAHAAVGKLFLQPAGKFNTQALVAL
jgi:hypothetical protein